MKKERMRQILMEEGFKVPEDATDLRDYVYRAVNRCINEALAEASHSRYEFKFWLTENGVLCLEGPRYMTWKHMKHVTAAPFYHLARMVHESMHGEADA